ncbi:hypothetical protein ACOME3_006151 [Neoechinorhynchus agilis]
MCANIRELNPVILATHVVILLLVIILGKFKRTVFLTSTRLNRMSFRCAKQFMKSRFSSKTTNDKELVALLNIVDGNLNTMPKLVLCFDFEVPFSSLISIAYTQQKPKLSFCYRPGNLYTIIMVDPDARSPKNRYLAPWLHWLVVNITSCEIGTELNPYVPPAPPQGIHRYVTLFYEQKDVIDTSKVKYTDRNNFPFKTFVKRHKLRPMYGHMFKVDSGVPE